MYNGKEEDEEELTIVGALMNHYQPEGKVKGRNERNYGRVVTGIVKDQVVLEEDSGGGENEIVDGIKKGANVVEGDYIGGVSVKEVIKDE